ncbi:MAG: hypothetical protein HKN78_09425 [Sphingomonadaceae bacterium]|nr:hypothetical protein [Sphingomonadaceae bacterium]
MARIKGDLPDTGARDDVREELIRIFGARQFARSPVMRGLLAFLVETSLAGDGERLKAYTIAVDALGRPPNFDAQADSYPRVQVGRLRGLLAAFYEENGIESDVHIAIPKGAYAVRFDAPLELCRVEDEDAVSTGTTEAAQASEAEAAAPSLTEKPHRFRYLRKIAAAFIGIGVATTLVWYGLADRPSAGRPAMLSVALPDSPITNARQANVAQQACTKYWPREKCDRLFGEPAPVRISAGFTAAVGS